LFKFYLPAIAVRGNAVKMDTLVAKYSGSAYQDELYSEEQQRNLTECLPPISLKFDLPPVAKVSCDAAGCGPIAHLSFPFVMKTGWLLTLWLLL
jgi:hypothetical protein